MVQLDLLQTLGVPETMDNSVETISRLLQRLAIGFTKVYLERSYEGRNCYQVRFASIELRKLAFDTLINTLQLTRCGNTNMWVNSITNIMVVEAIYTNSNANIY